MNSIIILLVIIGIVAGLILALISKRQPDRETVETPQPAKTLPLASPATQPAKPVIRQAGTAATLGQSPRWTPATLPARKSQDPPAPPQAGALEKLRLNEMFWGVEFGQPGCEASHALLGQQFPFDDVPELPMAECSSAMCTCQFKGLKNRRCMHRRRYQDRRKDVRFDSERPERRSRRDRRRGNQWNDRTY